MSERIFTYEELCECEAEHVYVWQSESWDTRWNRYFENVFEADDGKLYKVLVCEGLTENQETYGAEVFPGLEYGEDKVWRVTLPEVEIYEEMVPVKKCREV